MYWIKNSAVVGAFLCVVLSTPVVVVDAVPCSHLCSSGNDSTTPMSMPQNTFPPFIFASILPLDENGMEQSITSCQELDSFLVMSSSNNSSTSLVGNTLEDCMVQDEILDFFEQYCGCPGTAPPQLTCPGLCGPNGGDFEHGNANLAILRVGADAATANDQDENLSDLATCEALDFTMKYSGYVNVQFDCNAVWAGNLVPTFCGCNTTITTTTTSDNTAEVGIYYYPPCYLCGDESKTFGTPEATPELLDGFRCGTLEQAGRFGLIPPEECALGATGAAGFVCGGCVDKASPTTTTVTSAAPTMMPTPKKSQPPPQTVTLNPPPPSPSKEPTRAVSASAAGVDRWTEIVSVTTLLISTIVICFI